MKANIAKKVRCLICDHRHSPDKMTLIKDYARWYQKPGGFKFNSRKAMLCITCLEFYKKRRNGESN